MSSTHYRFTIGEMPYGANLIFWLIAERVPYIEVPPKLLYYREPTHKRRDKGDSGVRYMSVDRMRELQSLRYCASGYAATQDDAIRTIEAWKPAPNKRGDSAYAAMVYATHPDLNHPLCGASRSTKEPHRWTWL